MYHDFRNDYNFHGNLMGAGLRGMRGYLYPDMYPADYTRLSFVSAQALNINHYFNQGLQRTPKPDVSFSLQSTMPQNGQLVFNVSATDPDGLSLIRLHSATEYRGQGPVERVLFGEKNFNGTITTPYFDSGTPTIHRLHVFDRQGNRIMKSFMVVPEAGHNAPWPFIRINPPIGSDKDLFTLNASWSHGVRPLMVQWDLNNNGIFDDPRPFNEDLMVNLPAGNHLIRQKVIDPFGNETVSTPVALHVSGDLPPESEMTFTLIDAATDEPIPGFDPLLNGAKIDLMLLPENIQFNIRANVPERFESVRFDLNGKSSFRIENVSPYALFGDEAGDYAPGSLPLGIHTLSATSFTEDGATGQSGPAKTIRFIIVEEAMSFTLIDAITDQPIPGYDPIPTYGENAFGAQINPFDLPSQPGQLSVRANVPSHFESVDFDGFRVENELPYSMGGDNQGDYQAFPFPVGQGDPSQEPIFYFITPYTEDNAGGLAGPTLELSFFWNSPIVSITLVDAETNTESQRKRGIKG
jgi:hypothetical protein